MDASSASCGEAFAVFVPSESSPYEITINGTLLCSAGENIVYYDVGTLDSNGGFVPTTIAAFSQTVTVMRGSPSSFTLSCLQQVPEKAFTVIQSNIVVLALDLGLNVRAFLTSLTKFCFLTRY